MIDRVLIASVRDIMRDEGMDEESIDFQIKVMEEEGYFDILDGGYPA